MNALVTQDFLINQHENVYHFFESLLFNSFIILILIDYIVYRFQTMEKIKMLEKMHLDNQTQITKAIANMNETCTLFEQRIMNSADNSEKFEKTTEEYKAYVTRILTGLCTGIDNKLLDINFQIQEEMSALEKKLKILINSELDKVDDCYDKLSRNLLLLQSDLSESCENNSEFQTMIHKDLDIIQDYVISLAKECRERMDETDKKMNEWSGSQLDSKICDLYCCVGSAIGIGEGIQRTIKKIIEVNFPHIKFNEIPNDVCVRNLKLMNPNYPNPV